MEKDETESDDPSNYYGSINTTGQKGGMTEDEPDDQRDQPGYRDSDQRFLEADRICGDDLTSL